MSDSGMLQRLFELQEKGERLRARSAEISQEIAEIIPTSDHPLIALHWDEKRVITAVDIDPSWREQPQPNVLTSELSLALMREAFLPTTRTPDAPFGARGILQDYLAGGTRSTDPQFTENDFHTVKVTTVGGAITAIECAETWVRSTPDRLIAEEIVRIAQLAAAAETPSA